MKFNLELNYEKTYKLSELSDLVGEIYPLISAYKIFLLSGDLGAGKTTFLKMLLHRFGVMDPVTSPTFSIVNEYMTNDNQLVYHMDLYRLRDSVELIEIGIPDMLDGQALCFIEWPEFVQNFLSTDVVHIYIEHNSLMDRKLKVTSNLLSD
jgi:tRNA threonylcarbamoyladenosine biosynthesis protein TsaE